MGSVVTRVDVRGQMLTWARQRAGLGLADLTRKFPKLSDWESGNASPTLKQLEAFANATHTPVGFFFLQEPPDMELPLPDFRTRGSHAVSTPSPDLLDTIFQAEQRQEWYADYTRASGGEPCLFVGSATRDTRVEDAALDIRSALAFEVVQRGSTWDDAFRILSENAEEIGILIMVSGIVGSNTRRKLNVEEFQGFALSDPYAPVVFINGNDTKAAKIFTLVHEIAHLWRGQSALDVADPGPTPAPAEEVERWCNEVAAEMLVPLTSLRSSYRAGGTVGAELDRLARKFKVSTLVILRRLRSAGYFDQNSYWDAYRAELDRVMAMRPPERGDGGNFYNTQPVRVSRRFARAVIANTLEGHTLYRDAFQMLGFRKLSAFNEMAHKLGVS